MFESGLSFSDAAEFSQFCLQTKIRLFKEFEKFEDLESAFAKEEVHPGDLKASVEFYLNRLLDPVRKKFETPALKTLTNKAYPVDAPKKVKGPPSKAVEEIIPSR